MTIPPFRLISRLVLNLRIISHRRPLVGGTTGTATFDPRRSSRPSRATELPTLHRVQTNISDIDLQFMNSRAYDKGSTIHNDTDDDQTWRL
ncbi:2817_t:CDS:1, partial [Acaulospora colombiana]